MARRTIVETFDDIDGTPVEDGGESISFAVDGVEYTIDLNKKNARDFRKKLDYYIEHATRIGGRKKRAGTARASDVNSPNPKEIREWAIGEGFEVPARGRLPQSLVDEYVAAH
ncbi:histone-like nucleoid-structuring protein Lsr2 [Rhodococcus sp. B50]|uniref:histone-like nucleoid-structuring protein Lsr2 n=1 Tax=Rhodococcus sp. B50 TaxID=2682847 RepID=UPI001BD51922|nr:Lsr2 family protein [Rhodococcus sp. B50]MBS9376346.1 Nucleoid-associated protein Lsr2 [Rhodococcus sp. B50]